MFGSLLNWFFEDGEKTKKTKTSLFTILTTHTETRPAILNIRDGCRNLVPSSCVQCAGQLWPPLCFLVPCVFNSFRNHASGHHHYHHHHHHYHHHHHRSPSSGNRLTTCSSPSASGRRASAQRMALVFCLGLIFVAVGMITCIVPNSRPHRVDKKKIRTYNFELDPPCPKNESS